MSSDVYKSLQVDDGWDPDDVPQLYEKKQKKTVNNNDKYEFDDDGLLLVEQLIKEEEDLYWQDLMDERIRDDMHNDLLLEQEMRQYDKTLEDFDDVMY